MPLHRGAAATVTGGLASRLTPTIVRLVVLLLVARQGSIDDVGRVALASAAAFLCGTLAEVGTMTSLSLPREYFGVSLPPLRATRRLRLAAAAGGTALFALFWAAGLGSHETVFLIVLPLPFLLALSYGYAGALNATRALALEGWISAVESAVMLGLTALLFLAVSPVAAALIALTGVRAVGTLARALVLRRRPRSEAVEVEGLIRRQGGFLVSTGAIVLHGQLDVVVLGFFSSFTLIGVYGPLLRIAYSTFLVAEGLTLAMYSLARDEKSQTAWLLRRWRPVGLLIGLAFGAIFLVAGEPLLELILSEPIRHLAVPIALFSILIPIRFFGYVQSVDIVRSGRQAARIPVLVVAIVVLLVGAIVGGKMDSITWLAAFRLASEVTLMLGFVYLVRRLGTAREPLPA
jgi:O-antigen/teichoic acid export membrane protein